MDPNADYAYLVPLVQQRWKAPRLLQKVGQDDMVQKILFEAHRSETLGHGPGRSRRRAWLNGV
jgi:hypothetical protein